MASDSADITQLLLAWRDGRAGALEELVPLVHRELHRIAGHFMRRQPAGHTLQTTALVNEAFLKLVDADKIRWQDRSHFFALSARLMRQILIDRARRKSSGKRGGEQIQVSLADNLPVAAASDVDVVDLDEALKRLAELSRRQSQVVELRYFGGLSEDQIAEALDVSVRTVRRDWSLARAWLFRELKK